MSNSNDTCKNTQSKRFPYLRGFFIGTVCAAALGTIGCTSMRTTEIEYTETEDEVALEIEDYTGDYEYTEDFDDDGDIDRTWAAKLDNGDSFKDNLSYEHDHITRDVEIDQGDDNEYEYELDVTPERMVREVEHEADDYELEESYTADFRMGTYDRNIEIETDDDEYEVDTEANVALGTYDRDVEVDTAAFEYESDLDTEHDEVEYTFETEDRIRDAEYEGSYEYEIDQNEFEREIEVEDDLADVNVELMEEWENGEYEAELEGTQCGETIDVEVEDGVVRYNKLPSNCMNARVARIVKVDEPEVVYVPVTRTVVVEPEEKPEVFVIRADSKSLLEACGLDTKNAYFRFDSSNLTNTAEGKLDPIAECLTRGPLKNANIEIIGYADPRGTGEYNLDLGMDRARSVADFLVSNGVSRNRIDALTRGERAAHGDPEMWPYDRRVELRIAD